MFTQHELVLIGLAIDTHIKELQRYGDTYADAIPQYGAIVDKILDIGLKHYDQKDGE